MTIEFIRSFLGWCLLFNIAMLMVWFLLIIFAHDWIYRYHSRFFKIPVETFDAIHYSGIAIYKIAIFMLNLIPYIALWLIGSP